MPDLMQQGAAGCPIKGTNSPAFRRGPWTLSPVSPRENTPVASPWLVEPWPDPSERSASCWAADQANPTVTLNVSGSEAASSSVFRSNSAWDARPADLDTEMPAQPSNRACRD